MKLTGNKEISSNTKAAKKKTLKIGMYTTAITAVAIAIVVFINLFVSSLPSDKVKFDTTSEELYSISEQTEQIVKGIDEDITIYIIASETTYDMSVYEYLERYTALNDNITIELKDPVLYPNFAGQYTDSEAEENSLIVVSGENSRYIPYSSIYVSDYSYDSSTGSYTSSYSFDVENQVTSAIDYVTNENLPIVYTLSGHGEVTFSDYSSAITEYIGNENITVNSLSLLKEGQIPEDADAIAILEPSSDISQDEFTMLKEYLDNGGNILIMAGSVTSDMANLTSLMNYYGMNPVNGLVVEGDDNYYYLYQTYLLPDYESHSITEPLANYYVMVPMAQGIELITPTGKDNSKEEPETEETDNTQEEADTSEDERNVTVQGLLVTSDYAYSKVAGDNITTYEKEDGDIDGPFYVAAIAQEENEETTGKMVYIGSVYVMDDSINQVTSGGNADFVMNSLEYMLDRDETISIRAKSLDTEYLTIDSGTAFKWQVILIGIIPLALIIWGGAVCYQRRKM